MDKISIIVPIYNAEKYIERCLESLVNQTYKNIEVILINDGSTDKTIEILKKYKKKYSKILKLIDQENKGIGASRNKGLSLCTGNFIAFVDSDDYIETNMYEKLYNELIKTNSDIVVCDYYKFNSNTKEVVKVGVDTKFGHTLFENPKMLNEIDYAPWNKLYKKELFSGIEFPVKLKYEDFNTILKVFDRAKKITKLNLPLYNYLINDNGETCTINERDFDSITIMEDIVLYFQKYKNYSDFWLELEKLCVGKLYHTLTSTLNLNNKEKSIQFTKEMFKLLNINFKGWKKRRLKKYKFLKKILMGNKFIYCFWIKLKKNRNCSGDVVK